MVIDVLLNLANRQAFTLGEKIDERPMDAGRQVLYTMSRPNLLNQLFSGIPQLAYRAVATRMEDTVYFTDIKHGVDSHVVAAVNDFVCPHCGTEDVIRLLCGGGVDDSNPDAPIIAFGNWDAFLSSNKEGLKHLDIYESLVQKQRIRIDMLQPLERENELIRSDLEEKKALLKHQAFLLMEATSENNRLSGELGRIMSYVEAKKLIRPEDAAQIKNALEVYAFGKQMMEGKLKTLEDRRKVLEAHKEGIEADAQQLREAGMDLEAQKARVRALEERYGYGRGGYGVGRPGGDRGAGVRYDPVTGQPIRY